MASPSTLGVSNAAVFGANVSIIGFAGGFLSTGHNVQNFAEGANPFATSSIALIFAVVSTLLILGLCSIRAFSSETVVLAGIALGTVWTAGTTLLQFFATDVGLSAAVIWSFGDLGRATFTMDYIMLAIVGASAIAFFLLRWRFNAVSVDGNVAKTLGVHVRVLRFVTLFLASLITAVVVSFLGIIGFVGIICPHVMRRIIGNNHRFLIPGSLLCGSALLLLSNIASHLIGNGTALPVGSITALLGGPFFLYLLFTRRGGRA
jgi:iron complex transport system permease protein